MCFAILFFISQITNYFNILAKCGPNQVPTTCASNCPANCDSMKSKMPIPCILSCKVDAKCECAPGYVQRSAIDATCILKSECPGIMKTAI